MAPRGGGSLPSLRGAITGPGSCRLSPLPTALPPTGTRRPTLPCCLASPGCTSSLLRVRLSQLPAMWGHRHPKVQPHTLGAPECRWWHRWDGSEDSPARAQVTAVAVPLARTEEGARQCGSAARRRLGQSLPGLRPDAELSARRCLPGLCRPIPAPTHAVAQVKAGAHAPSAPRAHIGRARGSVRTHACARTPAGPSPAAEQRAHADTDADLCGTKAASPAILHPHCAIASSAAGVLTLCPLPRAGWGGSGPRDLTGTQQHHTQALGKGFTWDAGPNSRRESPVPAGGSQSSPGTPPRRARERQEQRAGSWGCARRGWRSCPGTGGHWGPWGSHLSIPGEGTGGVWGDV